MISYTTTLKFFTLLLNIMNMISAFILFAQGLFVVFWPNSFLNAISFENFDADIGRDTYILAVRVFGAFATIFGAMCLALEIFGCYNIIKCNATNLKRFGLMQIVMFAFCAFVCLSYAYTYLLIPHFIAKALLILFAFMLATRLRREMIEAQPNCKDNINEQHKNVQ